MAGCAAESLRLAARDWAYERSLTLCAVLALASMLTPMLVLLGIKNGVITTMRERLLADPGVLIITPKSDAGRFPPAFIEKLRALPGARFAIGRTRETSTDMTVRNAAARTDATLAMEPAAPGEPVLEHYGIAAPRDGAEPEIVLSAPAARALKVEAGGKLAARLGRRTPQGRLESVELMFRVAGILPAEAAERRMGFVPLAVLEDAERYRDYLAVPGRGFDGDPAEAPPEYASFRLYAASLDRVEDLAAALEGMHIEVITRAREIAAIRMLEKAIGQVIAIISAAVGAGFLAFTISSVQGAVTRKRKMLGMLRLLGFSRGALMLYPLTQTLLTATAGFCLSLALYWGVSLGIAHAFASQGGALACSLSFKDALAAGGCVYMLSILACLRAARTAASIEPSAVIREV